MSIDKQKLQKLLWSEVASWKADCSEWKQSSEALGEFLGEKTVEEVALELLAENERLTANVKLNLCDHPAVHWGDVDLLVASVSGTSQIELAKVHGCTPPNISRKIRRVKGRLGWREGMSVVEIRARAEQLRALASQGAVVTADLMAERDQLKAENEALRREREGKVLCDLELFETLRDAANTEADEHRQCMATYRPLRQENLDSVVKKCDDLLAAMGKGEQS